MSDNLRILAALVGVTLLFVVIRTCADADQHSAAQVPHPAEPTTLPTITVKLLGSISAIGGGTWPLGPDGKPILEMAIEFPHIIAVKLPGGRTISHFAKLTFVSRESNTIYCVVVTASDRALPLQQALSQLEDILKDWNAELDDNTKRNMIDWRKDGDLAPGSQFPLDGGAILHGESKVLIGVTVGPSLTGWYVSLTPCITPEETDKLLKAEYAQSQPSTAPSSP